MGGVLPVFRVLMYRSKYCSNTTGPVKEAKERSNYLLNFYSPVGHYACTGWQSSSHLLCLRLEIVFRLQSSVRSPVYVSSPCAEYNTFCDFCKLPM